MPKSDPVIRRELDHLKELMAQRAAAEATARQIQADELARRLEVLNHAHERTMEERASFVNKDIWEQHVLRLDEWKDEQNEFRANLQGRIIAMGSAFGVGLTLVSIALSYILNHI